jgi:hypothetical protein
MSTDTNPPRSWPRRFRDKVDASAGPDGCWLWTDRRIKRYGYGQFNVRTDAGPWKPVRAHRMAWTLMHGAIPDGKVIMHTCDVTHCVNPRHLRIGTQADNLSDMRAKGRGFGALTPDQVRLARAWLAKGVTATEIASRLGVSLDVARRAADGTNYKWVTE